MRSPRPQIVVLVFCLLLALNPGSASAKSPAADQPVSVTVVFTALAPGYLPGTVSQSQLAVSSGKQKLAITSLTRADGTNGSLQLAILIDDNIRQQLSGAMMRDIEDFIMSQPPSTSIGLFVAQKGKAIEAASFSLDHQAAAKSLMRASSPTEPLRVYPSLTDLAAHWPSPPAARREILMIGSGYDALLGGMLDPNMNAGAPDYAGSNYDRNIMGEQDPYLNSILGSVEQAGIEVHSIYVPDPEFAQMAQASIMRDKLIQVSTLTGGLAFYNETSPDSFPGFLRELSDALHSQYLLTFSISASRKRKGELRAFHISAGDPDITIYAPEQVFIPGAGTQP